MADTAIVHPDEDLPGAGHRRGKVHQVQGVFENRPGKFQEHGFHGLTFPAAIFPINIGASVLRGKSIVPGSRFQVGRFSLSPIRFT
jgi:hypothetical protein